MGTSFAVISFAMAMAPMALCLTPFDPEPDPCRSFQTASSHDPKGANRGGEDFSETPATVPDTLTVFVDSVCGFTTSGMRVRVEATLLKGEGNRSYGARFDPPVTVVAGTLERSSPSPIYGTYHAEATVVGVPGVAYKIRAWNVFSSGAHESDDGERFVVDTTGHIPRIKESPWDPVTIVMNATFERETNELLVSMKAPRNLTATLHVWSDPPLFEEGIDEGDTHVIWRGRLQGGREGVARFDLGAPPQGEHRMFATVRPHPRDADGGAYRQWWMVDDQVLSDAPEKRAS